MQSCRHADIRQANVRVRVRIWLFDPRVSTRRGPAMDCVSADTQTNRWDWTPDPTPATIQPAWVISACK